jgi:hypothetical protein
MDGYNVMMGGKTFSDMSRHPNIANPFGRGNSSTAAGRYQFLHRTWQPVAANLGLKDFSPHSQDIGAIALIAQRGALQDVMRGDIQTATRKLNKEWASLPGSPYGQRTLSFGTFFDGFKTALEAIGRGIELAARKIGKVVEQIFNPEGQQQPASRVGNDGRPVPYAKYQPPTAQRPAAESAPAPRSTWKIKLNDSVAAAPVSGPTQTHEQAPAPTPGWRIKTAEELAAAPAKAAQPQQVA